MKYEVTVSVIQKQQKHIVDPVENLGLTKSEWDTFSQETRWVRIMQYLDLIIGDKGWVLDFIKEI